MLIKRPRVLLLKLRVPGTPTRYRLRRVITLLVHAKLDILPPERIRIYTFLIFFDERRVSSFTLIHSMPLHLIVARLIRADYEIAVAVRLSLAKTASLFQEVHPFVQVY